GFSGDLALLNARPAYGPNRGRDTRRRGKLVLVLPQQIALHRVQCLDDAARIGQIHDAVVHERRGLLVSRSDGPGPGELELPDVLAIDLIERTVAPAIVRTSPVKPVGGGRVQQRFIGYRTSQALCP